jgi:hypothetical protein
VGEPRPGGAIIGKRGIGHEGRRRRRGVAIELMGLALTGLVAGTVYERLLLAVCVLTAWFVVVRVGGSTRPGVGWGHRRTGGPIHVVVRSGSSCAQVSRLPTSGDSRT